MNDDKATKKEEEFDLKEAFIILVKRKWWLIGTILIILTIGLLYVFLTPVKNLLTYQIKLNDNYSNITLSELYPNYENKINFISIENFPVIFKSTDVFKSLDKIDPDIDYMGFSQSESFNISLNENTSIFNISVSNPDYNLADNILKTLISAFTDYSKNRENTIIDEIIKKIELDINDLENESNNYENIVVVNLENELDILYEGLNRYIVDYNVELSDELEKNKNSENVSFYNVIIPPNDISDKINKLQAEVNVYREKILKNKNEAIVLNNLKNSILKDENIIKNRVDLVSAEPFYKLESNRIRNLGIVIVLSILIGILFTFFINFLIGLKTTKKNNKLE
jgi:hypothetical protein